MVHPTIIPAQRLQGRVLATLAADALQADFQTIAQPWLTLAFEGIPADRHFGWLRAADARTPHYRRGEPIRNVRQLSIVSVEELAEIAAHLDLPGVKPEWLGANLVLEGIPALSFLPRGTRIAFPSGAALAAEGYNPPCTGPGKAVHQAAGPSPQAFVKAASRRRGIVASVEKAGLVRAGDAVKVFVPEQWIFSA